MGQLIVTEVAVTDISTDGCGIGRTAEGRVIKVREAFPGDIVHVEFDSQSKTMPKARALEFIERSPGRVEHPCRHYSEGCVGCPLGAYDYSLSLDWKRRNLQETLKRIGGVSIDVPSLIESPKKWHYRDRIELGMVIERGNLRVGYRAEGRFLPINDCLLADNAICAVIRAINDKAKGIFERESADQSGGMKIPIGRLLLRTNGIGGIAASVSLDAGYAYLADSLGELLGKIGLAGWIIKADDTGDLRNRLRIVKTAGNTDVALTVAEKSTPAKIQIFSQVNQAVAGRLLDEVVEQCRKDAKVLDLFGGWGMFGLTTAVANNAEVIVVDVDGNGLAAGSSLAAKLGLNVKFIRGNLFKPETWEDLPHDFDTAIVDPPFKGLDSQGIDWLDRYGPPKLIYISCHPAGLARDTRQLMKYRLDAVKPFDMFPQTTSLETLAVFRRL